MIRAFFAVAAVLLVAGVALAVPEVPVRMQIVPVYSTPPGIRVTFIEGEGAEYYTVFRRIGAGQEAAVTSIPSGGPGHRATWLDTAVVANQPYAYRLEACDATVCTPVPGFTTSVTTVWPISGGQRVITGFNENIASAGLRAVDGAVTGFHDGIDLGRTTTGATPADDIVAPRGGVVVYVTPPNEIKQDDAFVQIRVDVGHGNFEFDGFNHISTNGPFLVMPGDIVAAGDQIAVIGTRHFDRKFGPASAFDDHTHFQLGTLAERYKSPYNPLLIFADDADRDPLGNPPGLNDENGDGRVVWYRNHTTGQLVEYDLATHPLHGDIDVAAEVTDIQGTNPHQAPVRLGYWIEGPLPNTEHFDDVKSATNPYRLHDYHTEYWGTAPATACDLISELDDRANDACKGVKLGGCVGKPHLHPTLGCDSRLKEPVTDVQWGWPILHHFIVTHAGTETAARTGLSKNQFWRTAAKDDGGPVGSAHANYANQPTTTKAWEARFPDGDYTIHLLASDLVHHNVQLSLPTTRLENFAPFIREMLVTADTDGNPVSGIPQTPGCEDTVYAYANPARRHYPETVTLAVARQEAATKPVPGGRKLCVRVRFSEPMTESAVELVRARGTGALLSAVVGTLQKTHQDNDTWLGAVTLGVDPSGNSDSSFTNDEKDIAIRVTARDRRDGANVRRTLDSDGDGTANPSGDVNHLIKIDLSPMKKTVGVTQ